MSKPYKRRMTLIAAAIAAVAFAGHAAYNQPASTLRRAVEALSWSSPHGADRSHRQEARGALTAPVSSRAMPGQADANVAVARTRDLETLFYGGHTQKRPRDAAQRMPRQPVDGRLADSGFDPHNPLMNPLNRPSMKARQALEIAARSDRLSGRKMSARMQAALACDPAAFGSLSGAALVSAVKAADQTCLNQLYSFVGTSSAYPTFREAQMATVANALRTSAQSYNGTNADSTLQLVMFLRAGYYVHYYDANVGAYGTTLKTAIRGALDAVSANGAFFNTVNDVNGETLSEAVVLIDSSEENARYVGMVKRILDGYNSSYNAYYWMKSAVNSVYTVTWRGHQNSEFQTLVQSDPSIVDTLYNFANRNWSLLGTSNDYLVSNAAREAGRFLQYTGATKSLATSRAKALADRSAITGTTAPVWIGVADMVDYYDKANCSYYNMCDVQNRVKAAVLPIRHVCSATLTLVAQAMTSSELSTACATVAGEESYFHQQLATGGVPVANDKNTALEMVVFNSSKDYGTYAGVIYGIDTNNGGMYLEGDPSVTGNQARFIAYEAEWMLPKFEIWNLTHEYVHYLDGRFDMYGDFGASISQKTVWWIEGMAEYISYSYRNLAYDSAISEAATGRYALSTIYQNDYGSGQTRVYNWGYLASRFMFEKRRSQVTSILGYFRPGNYTGYASYMTGLGTSNDTAFAAWLPCVGNPSAPGCGGPANQLPVAGFNSSVNGLTVAFTDTSTDADGSIAARNWNFGDGTTSTQANPSKTYAAAGTYTVSLTVTDNVGGQNTVSKSVTVTSTPPPTGGVLSNGVPKSGLAAAQGQSLQFTLDVPAGATNLKFAMSGGTGDADLYVRFGAAPTTTTYDCRPWLGGNNETCTIATAQAGRYYVMVNAYSAFSAVSLTGSYTTGSTPTFPECTDSNTSVLGKNCKRSNRSVGQGGLDYMYIFIPAGTPQLKITTSGGTGNADLYFNPSNWATSTAYTQASRNAGNGETITVVNPPSGYLYISLHGVTAASGVSVVTQY